MNYNRHNAEDSSDSSSGNEFSGKNGMAADQNNMYEDVSDSEIDEKEHADRMNDVGVVDITYAQRTVWLVKVYFFIFQFIFTPILPLGSRFFS